MASDSFSPSSVNLVIYHRNCPDGFGAAFAAWLRVKQDQEAGVRSGKDTCEFIACQHGDRVPNVQGKNVAILDFSFDAVVTSSLVLQAKDLIVIDHHISAEVDLVGVPERNKIFDMKHSGAFLAWKFFHPKVEVPRFILLIEDKDLWKWQFKDSKEFSSSLTSVPYAFPRYEALMQTELVDELITAGKYRLELQDSLIMMVMKRASFRYLSISHLQSITTCTSISPSADDINAAKSQVKDCYLCLVANSSVLQSEIGNMLLSSPKNVVAYREFCSKNATPELDAGVIFSYNAESKSWNVSLRSTGVDVCRLAKIMGGGGHTRAAAFNYVGDIENLFFTPE